MVRVYGLFAITCIINGPFEFESMKRAMSVLETSMSVRRVAQTFNVR